MNKNNNMKEGDIENQLDIDTPILKMKRLNHRIEMENKEEEHQLKTCCGTLSDRRLLIFIASMMISMTTVIFSCYQLSRDLSCESQNTYIGLLTLILGVWLKSPIS